MKGLLLWFVVASGCYSEWKAEDVDGDGRSILEGDCWESSLDPAPPEGAMNHGVTAKDIYVGAEDLPYDGIDANCDGKDDFDADEDGFVPTQFEGIKTLGIASSGELPGNDCWDAIEEISSDTSIAGIIEASFSGADVYPGAADEFYDGIDSDCAGNDDFDADEDGYTATQFDGVETQLSEAAPLPSGDCFDVDTDSFDDPTGGLVPFQVNPGATEGWYDGADQNCDGESDCDQDGDGFEVPEDFCSTLNITSIDCNDIDGTIFPDPSITEIYYNGIDENCDLADGDGDKDGDGHWDVNYPFSASEVDVSVVYPTVLDDCWDDDANPPADTDAINSFSALAAADVSPSATERYYDGIDQDCNGGSDFDADLDTFQTEHYPDRTGATGTDCVDSETDSEFVAGQGVTPADIYPNNPTENWYDGNDQNCDDWSDYDQDQDGQDAVGYQNGTDCDDTNSSIFYDPNENDVDELVDDGVDQNCDGLELCYIDFDEDSYGNSAGATGLSSELSCITAGFATNTDDCNDSDGTVYPSAPSICDGQFNDCLNTALPAVEIDNDGDLFVDCTIDSGGWDGDSSILGGDDCDDNDPILFPTQVWYADTDSDSYGDLNNTQVVCLQPAGHVLDSTDCNDGDNTVYPGANELCDGQDNDCSGAPLPVESDLDSDLYVDCTVDSGGWDGDPAILGGDDCNDANDTIFPTATEGLNDGVDQNCDNQELCPVDADLDNFGDSDTATGLSSAMDCFQTGFSGFDTDCDDSDANAFPGAAPIDSVTDCMLDADGDDYGDLSPSNLAITAGTDCDDSDNTITPVAVEGVNDGVDQNCDNQELCYIDSDLDSHGNLGGNTGLTSTLNCVVTGFSDVADDCDDNDDSVFPNAPERCDGQFNDCNNQVLQIDEIDDDGDGWVDCTIDSGGWDGVNILGGDDCDDGNEWLYPSGTEWCDGIANICNTTLDPNEEDDDGDFYVECTNWTGSGLILGGDDCNDGDGTVYPTASELCDGQYNDCYDGSYSSNSAPADELDDDSDLYVDCTVDGGGWDGNPLIVGGDDCNDGDASINPVSTEGLNDGVDQNCDDLELCPVDGDLDGFGDSATATGLSSALNCNQAGFSGDDTDCDDANAFAFPGAATADSLTACMLDLDEDNYGDVSPANGAITAGTDCDDGNSAIHPIATETANDGVDQNCDNQELCYIDSDEDTYGNDSGTTGLSTSLSCDGETGFADNTSDCDDNDDVVYPTASELCDGQYNDCSNGSYSSNSAPADELDDDGDDYVECIYDSNTWVGSGSVIGGEDCDDTDSAVYPTADEACDGQYNDCDDGDYNANSAPDDELDDDGDTYVDCTISGGWVGSGSVTGGGDCDDNDATVYPGAAEVCDGQYNDCSDGSYSSNSAPADELDDDGDTYVDCSYDSNTWVGSGSVTGGDDCDDNDVVVYPGAPEICDGQYNDCDDNDYNANSAPADELDGDGDDYVDCVYDSNTWVGSVSVIGGDDCDDSDASVYPTADEDCDGRWTDCDVQSIPSDETDDDGDGYIECTYDSNIWVGAAVTGGDDCDDSDINAYPGAFEIIEDTIDQDCDGSDLTGLLVGDLSAGDLIITEIMPDGISDPSDEWFEIYNTTAEIIDIEGLYLGDSANLNSIDFTVSEHFNIGPGEYFLFMNNANPADNGGFTPTEGAYVDYSSFNLTNSSDSIVLYTDSITVTEINYDTDFLYTDGVSASVSDVSQLANDNSTLWCQSSSLAYTDAANGNQPYYGTPGQANDDCDADGDGDFAGLDCDDNDASLNLADADSDGETTCAGDCNDSSPTINTSATEVCDFIDNDCDGDIDDDDSNVDLSTGITYYLDDDGDGFGDNGASQDACVQPANHVTDNTDCDDGEATTYPFADEFDDDSVDSNCDGMEADANILDCSGLTYTNAVDGYDKYFVICFAPNYSTSWSWTDADNFCQSQGYEGLASILDATENSFVGSLITGTDENLAGRNFHIGLNDINSEGAYEWANGDAFSYDSWHPGEPSGGAEDCTEFYNTANTWNDLSCTAQRDFVCSTTTPH